MITYTTSALLSISANEEIEIYANKSGGVTFTNNEEIGGIFFKISKEDWEEIKSFIDKQLK